MMFYTFLKKNRFTSKCVPLWDLFPYSRWKCSNRNCLKGCRGSTNTLTGYLRTDRNWPRLFHVGTNLAEDIVICFPSCVEVDSNLYCGGCWTKMSSFPHTVSGQCPKYMRNIPMSCTVRGKRSIATVLQKWIINRLNPIPICLAVIQIGVVPSGFLSISCLLNLSNAFTTITEAILKSNRLLPRVKNSLLKMLLRIFPIVSEIFSAGTIKGIVLFTSIIPIFS